MPDVKVYIRTEDLVKWNAIEKKAQWLHDALGSVPQLVIGPLEITSRAEVAGSIPATPNLGMACCLLKTPCRHWSYANELWTNSLTGEVKEVNA